MRTCPEGFANVDGTVGQPMLDNTNGKSWLQCRQREASADRGWGSGTSKVHAQALCGPLLAF